MVEQVVHTPGQVVGRCSPALLTDPMPLFRGLL